VLPEFYSRERVTGEVKFEDHEIGSYELTRDWWFAPEVKQQYTDQTGKGPDSYTLSTQSEVKSHPPADWNKPVGVPYDIVKDVTTDAYLPMLDAVNAGKDVEVKGKLSVNLTAGQMLAIGASLNTGPDSQRLWNSFAARASTAFDGVNGADNLLTHAPEYFDNIGKQGIVDMYHLKLLQVRAEKAAEDNGVKWNDDLKKKFAEVSSPEQFRQLSEKERKLFTDVLLLTSSADHSPYEALAPLAVMQSDAPNAQPLISEDARSQAFEQIVKQFETMTFSPGNEPDWRKVAGPYENPDDRIYMEPTSELLRFVRDDQSSDAVKGMVFSQAGFQASLPESITKRLDDSKKDLEQEFKEEMQWKPVYSPKAGAPINYTRATNAASSLLAIASKEGSEAAWAVMDKYGIKAEDVLKLLSDYRSDKEMILKQALIDVLSPAAPAGQRTVFNAQQKEVDEWMKG
jgi:hypothetical protein